RRANRLSIKPWVLPGMAIQWGAFFVAAAIVVFYGVYGYFVESIVRIGFSVYQVGAVLGAIALVMTIDVPMFRGARSTGAIRWGRIPARSQYVLILLAVTRSEEHTSELQSLRHLVCRLLLENKKSLP